MSHGSRKYQTAARRVFHSLLIAHCSLLCVVDDVDAKVRVAVSNFNPEGVPGPLASAVSNFLALEMVHLKKFDVVDRKNTEAIVSEQRFQQSGCIVKDCAVELGKLLNAEKVVVGNVNKIGDILYLQASLVDVELGRVDIMEQVTCVGEYQLESAARALAGKLALSVAIEGRILKIDGDRLTVNKGFEDGAAIGQSVTVRRVSRLSGWDHVATGKVMALLGPNASDVMIMKRMEDVAMADSVHMMDEAGPARLGSTSEENKRFLEDRIRDLREARDRRDRKLGGAVAVGVGVGLGLIGATMKSSTDAEQNQRTATFGLSAALFGMGAFVLIQEEGGYSKVSMVARAPF